MAKEFHLPVSEVEAMPVPLFQRHVAYLKYEADMIERAHKDAARKK